MPDSRKNIPIHVKAMICHQPKPPNSFSVLSKLSMVDWGLRAVQCIAYKSFFNFFQRCFYISFLTQNRCLVIIPHTSTKMYYASMNHQDLHSKDGICVGSGEQQNCFEKCFTLCQKAFLPSRIIVQICTTSFSVVAVPGLSPQISVVYSPRSHSNTIAVTYL